MTKEQEFRKQTEEAKFEAFSLMCRKVADLEAKLKHAEENGFGIGCTVNPTVAWQKGAEFGYNKGFEECAKARINVTTISDCPIKDEWHYVKDGDLPKDEDWKWCVSYRGYCYVAKYEEMFGCWTNQEYSEVMQPYAWKEIVFPELKETE